MPRFRTMIFDCDSTLSAIEGIDELAVHCIALSGADLQNERSTRS